MFVITTSVVADFRYACVLLTRWMESGVLREHARKVSAAAKQVAETIRMSGVRSASNFYLTKAMRPGHTVRIQVTGLDQPIYVRTKGTDIAVALQIFGSRDYDMSWCPDYSQHVMQLCADIVEAGNVPVVVDGGANIGASTLWFANMFPKCRVLAVEPDIGNYRVLCKNVAGMPNVSTFRAALWNKFTTLYMEPEWTGWACRAMEQSENREPVRTTTIPHLLADRRYQPLIVKLDIEGAETGLLGSDNEWPDEVPLVIFEPHDNQFHWLGMWQGTGHAFFSTLTRRKREYLMRGENVFAFLHPNAD